MEAYRASIPDFIDDPDEVGEADSYRYFEDGLLLVDGGKILEAGPYEELVHKLAPGIELMDYRGQLISPGFVDTHIHYPQTEMIAR